MKVIEDNYMTRSEYIEKMIAVVRASDNKIDITNRVVALADRYFGITHDLNQPWVTDREPHEFVYPVPVMATILRISTIIGNDSRKLYVHELFYRENEESPFKWTYRNGSWLTSGEKVIAWMAMPEPFKPENV